jgi:hypothetical protein
MSDLHVVLKDLLDKHHRPDLYGDFADYLRSGRLGAGLAAKMERDSECLRIWNALHDAREGKVKEPPMKVAERPLGDSLMRRTTALARQAVVGPDPPDVGGLIASVFFLLAEVNRLRAKCGEAVVKVEDGQAEESLDDGFAPGPDPF